MDASRISFGEMVAAASGAALLLFMFFPWYGFGGKSVEVPGSGTISTPGADFNAWEAFSVIDLVLFLVAALALALALARAADAMPTGLPAPPATIVLAAGAIALLLVLYRIVDVPVPDLEGFENGRKIGIFLALLAAGGIAFGGYTAMSERARRGSRRR
jgi:hypothetical protein